MSPGMQTFQSLDEAENWASASGFTSGDSVSALYVSADRDTKPLTFLHPGFLRERTNEAISAPNFFIYVDVNGIEENIADSFRFEDPENETSIRATDLGAANLLETEGHLVSVRWESSQYAVNNSVVWVLSGTNDWFTRCALDEGWRPTWFIGVGDGCSWARGEAGQFGYPCVNMLDNIQVSIPVLLNARYWVTDHIVGVTLNGYALAGGEDPEDGDVLVPDDPDAKITARQVCFLSTLFRGNPRGLGFYGGARVFEIRPRHRLVDTQNVPEKFPI